MLLVLCRTRDDYQKRKPKQDAASSNREKYAKQEKRQKKMKKPENEKKPEKAIAKKT